jgi:uncharacterized membrane protein (UPF0127 family)
MREIKCKAWHRQLPLALLSFFLGFLFTGGWSPSGNKAFGEAQNASPGEGELQFLRQDGSIAVSITIEIADTSEARIKGLMERWFLPELHGMLFIFDQPEVQRFWMHNTPLSLDMLFVDRNRRILNIAESTTPMSDQTYASTGPAQYVVEVKAGFSKRHGIQEGMSIRWKAGSPHVSARSGATCGLDVFRHPVENCNALAF